MATFWGEGKRRPEPGKLLALDMWEVPKMVTALRGGFGLHQLLLLLRGGVRGVGCPLMEKLKIGREAGKKGSTMPIYLNENEKGCFQEINKRLMGAWCCSV